MKLFAVVCLKVEQKWVCEQPLCIEKIYIELLYKYGIVRMFGGDNVWRK